MNHFFLELDCNTVLRNSAGITEGFSMCGGDFVEVYNDPSQVGKKSAHRELVYAKVVVIAHHYHVNDLFCN